MVPEHQPGLYETLTGKLDIENPDAGNLDLKRKIKKGMKRKNLLNTEEDDDEEK